MTARAWKVIGKGIRGQEVKVSASPLIILSFIYLMNDGAPVCEPEREVMTFTIWKPFMQLKVEGH